MQRSGGERERVDREPDKNWFAEWVVVSIVCSTLVFSTIHCPDPFFLVVYYALPFVGIRLSPFLSAVVALTLVSGAYTAEIFRAGIEAIPSGQFEASRALGLSYRHMMVDVVLPQAVKIVIPPLTTVR